LHIRERDKLLDGCACDREAGLCEQKANNSYFA
jgi:hypothetical protein